MKYQKQKKSIKEEERITKIHLKLEAKTFKMKVFLLSFALIATIGVAIASDHDDYGPRRGPPYGGPYGGGPYGGGPYRRGPYRGGSPHAGGRYGPCK